MVIAAMTQEASPVPTATHEEPLVLAMPRRELFRVSGFTPKVDLVVLDSLSHESWFAAPSAIRQDIDTKEVRIGLVVRRPGAEKGGDLLISEDGVAVHCAAVPPEVERFGGRLPALKTLARTGGLALIGGGLNQGGIELIGYGQDDSLQELRSCFLLIYRLQIAAGQAAPIGYSWVSAGALRGVALDAVSTVVLAGL